MALIVKRGSVPQTPHTEFYAKAQNGSEAFTLEEIHGSYGFSGPFSRKVHLRSYPTEQVKPPKKGNFNLTLSPAPGSDLLEPYHLLTGKIAYGGDPIRARTPLVFGTSTVISVSKPTSSGPKDEFFRNGEKHELYFVQQGQGVLQTEYGDIPFRKGLYLVLPKGTTYRITLDSKTAWFLIIESSFPIEFPPHYLNQGGQAKLMAPIVETEIELPKLSAPVDKRGSFRINVKHGGGKVTLLTLGHHPFDLVGWEGALYPFAFDSKNHHGIAREIHPAPPMHQTFQTGNPPYSGFSICSFVPHIEDWHLKAVPAPYAHYNVDSDECMFFSNVKYGARQGVIEEGSLTFHPGALPHSPQGDAAKRSTGSRGKMSERLAVMLDTFFENLQVTNQGWRCRDKQYPLSWSENTPAKRHKAKNGEWASPSA